MNSFKIRKIAPVAAKQAIAEIGFDKSYIHKAIDKYDFFLLKIQDLTCPQSTILKQLALSAGADCAVHREVLTHRIEKTDVVLGATVSQYKKIAEKLKHQPFKLSLLSEELKIFLKAEPATIKIRNTVFDWKKKTYIMGILNITPDSFSDGGKFYAQNDAIEHFRQLVEQGADIIDIGGESTRPFSEKVPVEEEIARVIPVIKAIRKINSDIAISIDTRNAKTAKMAIEAGADIINDISGFDWDKEMVKVAAETQAPIIIMHSLDDPQKMQINPVYEQNIVDAIIEKLFKKTELAINAGIKKENIILDAGIGFGKTLEHNLEIIKRIEEFSSLGFATLAGVSRKSVITKILNLPPEESEEANISLASYMASKGVNILRVHDVEKHVKALKALDRVIKQKVWN
jgi:dihydropteroate synthase